MLANPPYLPTGPRDHDPDPWVDLALSGGPNGTGPTDRIVRALGDHLLPGGRAYLLTSSLQDRRALRRVLRSWQVRRGTISPVARRDLEGETLEVLELTMPEPRRLRVTQPHGLGHDGVEESVAVPGAAR